MSSPKYVPNPAAARKKVLLLLPLAVLAAILCGVGCVVDSQPLTTLGAAVCVVLIVAEVVIKGREWRCPHCDHSLTWGAMFTIHCCPYCGKELGLEDGLDVTRKK